MVEQREIDARAYVVVGAGGELAVEGELVRRAFRSLRMPHQVLKAQARDARRLYGVVDAMRDGELAGASFAGETAEGLLELVDVVDASAGRVGGADLVATRRGKLTAHNVMLLTLSEVVQASERTFRAAAIVGDGAAARAAVAACRGLGIQVVVVTGSQWTTTELLHESDAARRMRDLGALPALWPTGSPAGSSRFSSQLRLQFADLAASADLLVHAPSGDDDVAAMSEAEPIVPWDRTHGDALAVDLYYRSDSSPFLRGATMRGLHVVGGTEMLVRLTVRRVETWTGLRPEYETLCAAARRVMAERPR